LLVDFIRVWYVALKLVDGHQDMRRKDLIKTLIVAMSLEESDVEMLDEAAMALTNLAKDCVSL
jgi:hypothetical protein